MNTVSIDPAHAVSVVADLLERLDDANPDVGIGPSRNVFVNQARRLLGVSAEEVPNQDVAIAAKSRDRVIGTLMAAVEKALEIDVFAGERLPSRIWKTEYEPVLTNALSLARQDPSASGHR
jgi:hypothetical protein